MIDYSRQELITGKNFLKKFANKRICIVGLGGLGSQIFFALRKMGFSNLEVIDFDKVQSSDLPRSALANEVDVGELKTDVAFKFGTVRIITITCGAQT